MMAKKPFRDVPALSPDQLGKIAAAMGRMPRMNRRAKTSMLQILIEAAIPDRHDADRIGGDRAESIKTASEIHTARAMNRVRKAGQALMNMPDEEWNRLVEEANRDENA